MTGAQSVDTSVEALDVEQLGTYFALMEAVSLLQRHVEQQLRGEGDLSYVQFQLLARLAAAHGQLTMTQLADGVVYSRSGLTYQAGLLEKAGLIIRRPSPDDERAMVVTVTEDGLALVDRVLPGHVRVVRDLLFDRLSGDDVQRLGDIMTRVRDHMRTKPPRSAAPPQTPPPWGRIGQITQRSGQVATADPPVPSMLLLCWTGPGGRTRGSGTARCSSSRP